MIPFFFGRSNSRASLVSTQSLNEQVGVEHDSNGFRSDFWSIYLLIYRIKSSQKKEIYACNTFSQNLFSWWFLCSKFQGLETHSHSDTSPGNNSLQHNILYSPFIQNYLTNPHIKTRRGIWYLYYLLVNRMKQLRPQTSSICFSSRWCMSTLVERGIGFLTCEHFIIIILKRTFMMSFYLYILFSRYQRKIRSPRTKRNFRTTVSSRKQVCDKL